MTSFTFETATKDQAYARIALAGPSGSGKTWTSLTFAARLAGPGERIAVIDTEHGSASKYADRFTFDRLNLTHYDPRALPRALEAAARAGFAVVIIDSLSRFWSGEGGMLEFVDNAARRGYGGNSFGGWKEARPVENAMIEAMLGYPGHVIATMRVKTAYEVVEDERGRKAPKKIGLAPEQRQGIEYEFDIVADLDLENTMSVSKSRCPELSGKVIRQPDARVAEVILNWCRSGREPEPAAAPATVPPQRETPPPRPAAVRGPSPRRPAPPENVARRAQPARQREAQNGQDDSTGHAKAIVMHFGRLGITDREERLAYTAMLAAAPADLGSTNDLDEAAQQLVAGKLSRCRDIGQVQELIRAGSEGEA